MILTMLERTFEWFGVIALWATIFFASVLVCHAFIAVVALLKFVASWAKIKSKEHVYMHGRISEMIKGISEIADKVALHARINVLNRDDSITYATLKDVPEYEQIPGRIVRVGGPKHPVDYIYIDNNKKKGWDVLFGNIELGPDAPIIAVKTVSDLNISTRIPGQKIWVIQDSVMRTVGDDGELLVMYQYKDGTWHKDPEQTPEPTKE